jgi:hypothetical protein
MHIPILNSFMNFKKAECKRGNTMRTMSLKLILLALIVALATPLAQSAEGETAPAIGQLYPVDWLEGAYVTPIDRASLMDPGIAGMVRWLDSPVHPTLGTAPT